MEDPNSWFRSSHQIEGVWVSYNTSVKSKALLPFSLRIKYYPPIIIEVNTMCFVGEIPVKIFRPKGRRLQSLIPRFSGKYTVCKRRCRIQKILENIHEVFKIVEGTLNVNEAKIDKIDRLK